MECLGRVGHKKYVVNIPALSELGQEFAESVLLEQHGERVGLGNEPLARAFGDLASAAAAREHPENGDNRFELLATSHVAGIEEVELKVGGVLLEAIRHRTGVKVFAWY